MTKDEAVKAYDQLVQFRQQNQLQKTSENPGKVESHHILPISCGGEDVPENRINLLAKEHFMAHVYLWIIHHEDEFHCQTMCALNMMVKGTLTGNRKELRDFILLSEEYQKAREEYAQYCSTTIGSKITGKNNGAFGKHWYKDVNELSCGMFFDGEQPVGWILGKFQTVSDSCIPSTKGKIKIVRTDFSEAKYVFPDVAEQMIATGEWERKTKPVSEKGLANIQKAAKYRKQVIRFGIPPENKGKTKFINKLTNHIAYFALDEIIPINFVEAKGNVKCCINLETNERLYIFKDNLVPDGYVYSTTLNKKFLEQNNKHDNMLQKHEAWLKETQEMADYFTKYGFEETCKKFPGRSGTCSPESMLMRFIRARKLYGIKFESIKTGRKRQFQSSPSDV